MKPGTIFAVILLNLFVMLFLVFLIAINAPASDFKHTTNLPIFNVEGGYQTLQKKISWVGTAFLIKYRNKPVLVTARHVCEGVLILRIRGLQTTDNSLQVIAKSDYADICLLKPLKNSTNLLTHFKALNVQPEGVSLEHQNWDGYGYPGGDTLVKTSHRYNNLTAFSPTEISIEMTGLVIPGMSGGPLMSYESSGYNVIGIITGVSTHRPNNMSYAAPIALIWDLLKEADAQGVL